MKTKTLSILFALVMVLSMSVGVFAQDFSETWDEETVLTVFTDVDMLFPDLFADEDSDFLWVESVAPSSKDFPGGPDYNAKAPIEGVATDADGVAKAEFSYDPCGDGLVKFEVTLKRAAYDPTVYMPGTAVKYGPEKTSYIRSIDATVAGLPANVKKCTAKGEDNCTTITFNKNGEAVVKGFLYAPIVMTSGDYAVQMDITYSNYMTALWGIVDPEQKTVTVSGNASPEMKGGKVKNDYCQSSLETWVMPGWDSYARAKYDENTGEARFQVVLRNKAQESISESNGGGYKAKANYVIPADVILPFGSGFRRHTDYTCKYTVYNNANGAPRTDYCKFGEGIALGSNAIIRFDITIDHLNSAVWRAADGANIPFLFRVGGLRYLIGDIEFEAVDFPCPPVSRMQVKDPLHPFLFFKDMIGDGAISPSGAYGVYEGGLWGIYQKCGKYAYMAVRLANDGKEDEIVNLDNTAVAINGGTPMKYAWVLSTVEPEKGNKIRLEGGEEVTLILRAKVTDIPSQLNADTAMTGAVNFTDFGFYITGKVYSDHNNTNCVAAPK